MNADSGRPVTAGLIVQAAPPGSTVTLQFDGSGRLISFYVRPPDLAAASKFGSGEHRAARQVIAPELERGRPRCAFRWGECGRVVLPADTKDDRHVCARPPGHPSAPRPDGHMCYCGARPPGKSE